MPVLKGMGQGRRPARLLVAAAIAAATTLTPGTARAAVCDAASAAAFATPAATSVSPATRARSLYCAVNAVRAEHGLRRLRVDWHLTAAAQGHAADMLRRRYFSHTSPDGIDLISRARAVRWMRAGFTWDLGEVLAVGWGPGSTARFALQEWLESPGHREVVLDRRMRRAGVGLVEVVAPEPIGPLSVWVLDLGRRWRR